MKYEQLKEYIQRLKDSHNLEVADELLEKDYV